MTLNKNEVTVVLVIILAFVGTVVSVAVWRSLTEHGEAVMSDYREANSIEDVDQRIQAQNEILDGLKWGNGNNK